MLTGRLGGSVRWAVTGRDGGTSAPPYDSLNLATHVGDDPAAVAANRGAAAALLGVRPGDVVHMAPAHGREVAVVDGPRSAPVEGVDALVTACPGLALAALAADCVPLVLADPDAGVVAAVHAGWRGVRDDVVAAALDAMADLGAAPVRVRAVLGPAVCGRCYGVPAGRVAEVVATAPEAVATSSAGGPALDLRAGLLGRLADLGVRAEAVGGCTAESPGLFSHRRDGVTGRFAAMVVRDADPPGGLGA